MEKSSWIPKYFGILILTEISRIKLSRIYIKYTFFGNKNSQTTQKFNKQSKKEQISLFFAKRTLRFSGLISYPAETFVKKGQNREKRESFCPRKFLPLSKSNCRLIQNCNLLGRTKNHQEQFPYCYFLYVTAKELFTLCNAFIILVS